MLTSFVLGPRTGCPGHRGLRLRGLVVEDTAGKVLLQVWYSIRILYSRNFQGVQCSCWLMAYVHTLARLSASTKIEPMKSCRSECLSVKIEP